MSYNATRLPMTYDCNVTTGNQFKELGKKTLKKCMLLLKN